MICLGAKAYNVLSWPDKSLRLWSCLDSRPFPGQESPTRPDIQTIRVVGGSQAVALEAEI